MVTAMTAVSCSETDYMTFDTQLLVQRDSYRDKDPHVQDTVPYHGLYQ